MMNEFFHVARNDIKERSKLRLYEFDGGISSETLHTEEEFKAFKRKLFPNNLLSKFGETFLHNVFISSGPNMAFTNNEYFLETVFDLIRQQRYPHLNSRFTSIFGCLTLEDAKKIRETTFGGKGSIYKVSCKDFLKADMSLLKQCASIIGIQLIAEKYWSGIASTTPFWEILMNPPMTILKRISD